MNQEDLVISSQDVPLGPVQHGLACFGAINSQENLSRHFLKKPNLKKKKGTGSRNRVREDALSFQQAGGGRRRESGEGVEKKVKKDEKERGSSHQFSQMNTRETPIFLLLLGTLLPLLLPLARCCHSSLLLLQRLEHQDGSVAVVDAVVTG